MNEKTPRERLKESLRENAEHIETQWTAEMRSSISTARIFDVPRTRTDTDERR